MKWVCTPGTPQNKTAFQKAIRINGKPVSRVRHFEVGVFIISHQKNSSQEVVQQLFL
jgi:hypothetical protein